jgi:EAL domain-containing protein (putative c-di-GMP-specific phosphodiesterase class I)/DNA-binding response OmpR family regulator
MTPRDEVALVVDDDSLILDVLTTQLEGLGVTHVLTAESGDRAIELLQEHRDVSVLMTDLSMPGMDGPSFLRRLADMKCCARIILVSGAKTDLLQSIGELGRSRGLNVVGVMNKPVSPARLRALLELQGRGPGRPAGPVAAPAPVFAPDELRAAIATGEIRPWYQPKVDAIELRVTGVEALARWVRADGSLVSPAAFVPAIEHHGLSLALFKRMLEAVLADLNAWQAAGFALKASVNLSMDCTHRLDLADEIGDCLRVAGVPPSQVVIEVTESQLMTDRPASMETLTRLSLMGLTLSIDDFGTGYSNLAQLADLPFSELKLDGAFVRRAREDPKADAILQTTFTFGQSLALDVVAEGVENFDQLQPLRRNARCQVQGFLIARPQPAAQFIDWLAAWRPGLAGRPGCSRPFVLLVVDDSRFMRKLVESRLQQHLPGAEVLHAPDGDTALALAKSHPIDGATVDYHMPGLDGIDLIRRMRELRPAARYCLLTVEASPTVAQEAIALGAMYCPKPLNESQAERLGRFLLKP